MSKKYNKYVENMKIRYPGLKSKLNNYKNNLNNQTNK